jgi:H+-transporting ATPase
LLLVLTLDGIVGTLLSTLGVLGFGRLPWLHTAVLFGYAMIACLLLNNPLKVALIGRMGGTTRR